MKKRKWILMTGPQIERRRIGSSKPFSANFFDPYVDEEARRIHFTNVWRTLREQGREQGQR